MTLERHRSKLIPDIDFSAEGRLFVTDRQGTFPLRYKGSKKAGKDQQQQPSKSGNHKSDDKRDTGNDSQEMYERPSGWEYDPDYRVFDDLSSYRSFDPARDVNRKYKPKKVSNYERAMRDITGTMSSRESTSSLTRKVRRSRSDRLNREYEGRYGTTHSVGSNDSIRRFKRGQTPTLPIEMRDPRLRDQKRYRSLDVNALRKANRKREMNNNGLSEYDVHNGGMNGHVQGSSRMDDLYLARHYSEERLPAALFIVLGVLLLSCGVVRLLLSRWHEYFHALWTGALVSHQRLLRSETSSPLCKCNH